MSDNHTTDDSIIEHIEPSQIGVLILNLGTPDAPTTPAVRRYLNQFLSDPRVIDKPRWLWWLILHGVILRIRPRKAAHAYQQVWNDEGSPLLTISKKQSAKLQSLVKSKFDGVSVELAMRYGSPSIENALENLKSKNINQLIVLPLYPQYSATTTASTFDAIADAFKSWRRLPDLQFISHYHDNPLYIQALANSIRTTWDEHGRAEKLLLSFHGLPKSYLLAGDPYFCECQKTARLLAEELQIDKEQWLITFQSRVGVEPWLTPYTDKTLEEIAKQGTKSVQVVCPGFSADCLETLEEIDMQNRDIFLQAGGEKYHYIPALNDFDEHIDMMLSLIQPQIESWQQQTQSFDSQQINKLVSQVDF